MGSMGPLDCVAISGFFGHQYDSYVYPKL